MSEGIQRNEIEGFCALIDETFSASNIEACENSEKSHARN